MMAAKPTPAGAQIGDPERIDATIRLIYATPKYATPTTIRSSA